MSRLNFRGCQSVALLAAVPVLIVLSTAKAAEPSVPSLSAEQRKKMEKQAEELAKAADRAQGMGEFAEDVRLRKQLLQLVTRLHGGQNWRVTDARLEFEFAQVLVKVTPKLNGDQQKGLQEVSDLAEQATALKEQGGIAMPFRSGERSSTSAAAYWGRTIPKSP